MSVIGLGGGGRPSREELESIRQQKEASIKAKEERRKTRKNEREKVRRHFKSLSKNKLVQILMSEYGHEGDFRCYLTSVGLSSKLPTY